MENVPFLHHAVLVVMIVVLIVNINERVICTSDNRPFKKARHVVKQHGNISSSVEIASLKCYSRTAGLWSAERTELQDLRVLKTSHEAVNTIIIRRV